MTAWTPEQQAVRDDWGFAALELDPAFMSTVDPMDAYLAARRPAGVARKAAPEPQPDRDMTDAERAAFVRDVARERAILAVRDPVGELYAVAPLNPFRARQIVTDPDDGLLRIHQPMQSEYRPVVRGGREDGRDLLTRLGADPSRTRGMLRCPAHEDRHASLSWRLAPDGKPLLHCFRGCDFASIVAAA